MKENRISPDVENPVITSTKRLPFFSSCRPFLCLFISFPREEGAVESVSFPLQAGLGSSRLIPPAQTRNSSCNGVKVSSPADLCVSEEKKWWRWGVVRGRWLEDSGAYCNRTQGPAAPVPTLRQNERVCHIADRTVPSPAHFCTTLYVDVRTSRP